MKGKVEIISLLKGFLKENPFVLVEALYLLVALLYLIALSSYNQELYDVFGSFSGRLQEAYELLTYSQYGAVLFVFFGALIIFSGVALSAYVIRRYQFLFEYDRTPEGTIATVLCVVLTVILILSILAFLNNPILWALTIVVSAFVAACTSSS